MADDEIDDDALHKRICLDHIRKHGAAPRLVDYQRVYAQHGTTYPGDLYIVANYPVTVDLDSVELRDRIRSSAGPDRPLTDDAVDAVLEEWECIQDETLDRWTREEATGETTSTDHAARTSDLIAALDSAGIPAGITTRDGHTVTVTLPDGSGALTMRSGADRSGPFWRTRELDSTGALVLYAYFRRSDSVVDLITGRMLRHSGTAR